MNQYTAKLTEIAVALADELGPGWEYAAGEEYEHRRGCTRSDGAGIFILSHGGPGRLTVCPDYHTAAPTFAMWAKQYDCQGSITVGAKRDTAAIVKDIRRRLVPGYLEALRRMKAKQFERDHLRRQAKEAGEKIREILRGEHANYPVKEDSALIRYHQNSEVGCCYGEFDVGPDTTAIELHHVPNETAEQIAQLLRELPLANPAQN